MPHHRFVEKYKEHVKDGIFEVDPGLNDGVFFLKTDVVIPVLFGFHKWKAFYLKFKF